MHKIRFLVLALFSYIFLSGFLFEERGIAPSPHVEIKTDTQTAIVKKEIYDDFPIIKIKAFESSNNKKEKKISKSIKKDLSKPIKKQKKTTSRIDIKETWVRILLTYLLVLQSFELFHGRVFPSLR